MNIKDKINRVLVSNLTEEEAAQFEWDGNVLIVTQTLGAERVLDVLFADSTIRYYPVVVEEG